MRIFRLEVAGEQERNPGRSVYICNRINYHLMVGEEKQKIVRRQKIFITNMIVFEKLPS